MIQSAFTFSPGFTMPATTAMATPARTETITHMKFFSVVRMLCAFSPHLSSRKRREYAAEAEYGKNSKCRFHALQKKRVVFRRDPGIPDVKGEYEHGDSHAHHLPGQPHGAEHCRGHTVVFPVNRTHEIGRAH